MFKDVELEVGMSYNSHFLISVQIFSFLVSL